MMDALREKQKEKRRAIEAEREGGWEGKTL
jgi:hypothetical protein